MPKIFDMPWWWRVVWWCRGVWRRHVVGFEDEGWVWDGTQFRPATPAELAFQRYLNEEADRVFEEAAKRYSDEEQS